MMENKLGKLNKDFTLFAKEKGVSKSYLEDYQKHFNRIYTPYILEERQLHASPLDLFSRLLYDRIMFFNGEVDEDSCGVAIAQLLYLNSLGKQDISIYLNSPGGSVIDGISLIDTMNFIQCDISTLCLGMAASMGAVILSNGTKGKRYVLPHSRVMIHQVSTRMGGTFSDIKIEFEQLDRCKQDVYAILAKNMNKSIEEMEILCDRDNWFIGKEAIELGIADNVIE